MIKVENLSKSYGAFTAVDDVTFTAREGRVAGFLGPNGAGKSTTKRIMVGLTPATSGSADVSGRRFAELPNPGLEVGVLLDASAQHAGRTGREILTVARRMMGLLGEPEVPVLGEPANGLDPAGIRWMRDLLRGSADQGGTVLLSSHLLHEIEVIADDLVVTGQGRIVAHGTKAELLRTAGTLVRTGNVRELAHAPTESDLDFAPSSAPPTAPGSRRCSSSSPQTPNEKERSHDHHDPHRRLGARGPRAHQAGQAGTPADPAVAGRSSRASRSTPARASGCSPASASPPGSRPVRSCSGHPRAS